MPVSILANPTKILTHAPVFQPQCNSEKAPSPQTAGKNHARGETLSKGFSPLALSPSQSF
jgi:hypothetical protein